jgi:head-tail adaptor
VITAGDLDQRVRIDTPVTAEDELGAETQTWPEGPTVWAKVMETPGREFLKGDYHAEEKAVFVIRFRAIDSTGRVAWGGRTWRIDSVTGTPRDGFRWLHCTSNKGAN